MNSLHRVMTLAETAIRDLNEILHNSFLLNNENEQEMTLKGIKIASFEGHFFFEWGR